ncbi:MAG: PQQ-binding-like beta-propeller repeat protein [Gaiellaceae bacterium]
MRRLLLAVVAAVALGAPASAAGEAWDWLAYGRDTQLTNDVASSSITRANARDVKLWWSDRLDGAVIASPLSARVQVGVRRRQLVFAATEAGSIYAVSADTGAVVWQRTFPTTQTDACGTFGVSSTGAIDLGRKLLYVAAGDGSIHALDLATGAEAAPWPVQLLDRPDVEYVWGGLKLIGGKLYVPVASYCDAPDAHGLAAEGRIAAIDPASAQVVAMWDPVPGFGNLGGVWGWGGVSAAPGGSTLYTAVGNSYVFSDACGCFVDDVGYGDNLVALSTDLSQVLAANKPPAVPNQGDEDFGAAPLVFQPRGCPPLLAAKNKMGVVFVWARDRIDDGPIASLGLGDGTSPFVGAPTYDASRQMIVITQVVVAGKGTGYGLAGFDLAANCTFRELWRVPLGRGNQAPAIVVGNVVFAAGGDGGGFGAVDIANGGQLWSYPTTARTFAPLIEVGGTVFGGDLGGMLYAFRAEASPRPRPR